ncbi:MAG: hypothetical protein E6R03_17005 [Hyphomicrobiaceae bacterium]|nr:MAG: hypothetical protein E6R03_17005 [Hyphomicrobiaceae bacterium]
MKAHFENLDRVGLALLRAVPRTLNPKERLRAGQDGDVPLGTGKLEIRLVIEFNGRPEGVEVLQVFASQDPPAKRLEAKS